MMPTPLDMNTIAAATVHELKNLLGELTLSLDHIARSGCPGAESQVAGARVACRRITDKLVEMLTLYKLEGGHFSPAIDHHSPADFIEDLAHEARALAGDRLVIEVESAQAPPFAFFDRDLVESAMMNALHNALRHARTRIRLTAASADDELIFRVSDDGPGFPVGLIESPLDAPRASHQGTGLGLWFASSVARAHANRGHTGRVELRNDAGAVFSLHLP